MRAPQSLMAPTPADQVTAAIASSPLQTKYGTAVNRESATEILSAKITAASDAAAAEAAAKEQAKLDKAQAAAERAAAPRGRAREEKGIVEQVVGSSVFKQFARSAGREIVRGLFKTGRR